MSDWRRALHDRRGSPVRDILEPRVTARNGLLQSGVRRPCDLPARHDDLHLGGATLERGRQRDADDVGSAHFGGTGLTHKHVRMQPEDELGLVKGDLAHGPKQGFSAVAGGALQPVGKNLSRMKRPSS
jgi:hypothetical protein